MNVTSSPLGSGEFEGWLCEWLRKLPRRLNSEVLSFLSLSVEEERELRTAAFEVFVRNLATQRLSWVRRGRDVRREPFPASVLAKRVHSAVERSRSALDCLREAFQWHGLPVEQGRWADAFVLRLSMLDLADRAVAWMKFNLAYVFAKRREQAELPTTPAWFPGKPGILGSGPLYVRSRWLMRDCSWAASATFLLGVKRGMPEVADSLCDQALDKHRAVLSSPPSEGMVPLETLEAQVRRTVREIRPSKDRAFLAYAPSTSGHFEEGRAEGGAAGPVRDWLLAQDRSVGDQPLIVKRGHVLEGLPHGLDLYDRAEEHLYRSIGQSLPAVPVPIVEPLKVRMITKGPSVEYYLCKKLQREMWGTLQKRPYSQLCGRTLLEGGRAEEALRPLGLLRPDHFWVSGDYESATDLLHRDLSVAAILEWAACAGWDPALTELGVRSLVQHELHYKKGNVMQANGQLMGSPVSFPILCVVNLALSRYALELRAGRTLSLQEAGVVVNGDDVLFQTDVEGYVIWKAITASGGLKFSLGKNYTSRNWCMINSTVLLYDEVVNFFGEVTAVFHPVPWLNLGLLRGMQKGVGDIRAQRDVSPVLLTLGARCRDLCGAWPWERHSELVSWFIQHHRSVLDLCEPGVSWFLPRTLGGIGLPTWDLEGTLTNGQHKMATFLATRSDSKFARMVRLRSMGDCPLLVEALKLYRTVEPLLEETEADDLPWGGLCTLAWLRGADVVVKKKTQKPKAGRRDPDPFRVQFRRRFKRVWAQAQACTLHLVSGWKLRNFLPLSCKWRKLDVDGPILFPARDSFATLPGSEVLPQDPDGAFSWTALSA